LAGILLAEFKPPWNFLAETNAEGRSPEATSSANQFWWIWIRPASADFPPAGGVWGGMRAGFGLGVFGKKFSATKSETIG